ncbi:MAG: methylmalonyl Co-A mutase-associated GTPase MeaB [Deltaproteobacteria bacterium]|nr:methylmalonyl Co-A mutase-associated GTPase MeaB [Deltaproteobacteria bacterium]MBW2309195.1 methylmalonyl Co-A mutase-associated GTPase MeaB [Deltaproteobacteria bacterium]
MELSVDKILLGDVRTAARLMRELDDGIPRAIELLKSLYAHTGRAYVLGFTGSPGVGKSTLVDQVISQLRSRNKTVGVIAVDPTSPFSGGALLGDRIRMQRHGTDDGVFIRSLATRGQFGGLTRSTAAIVKVMDALGKDVVILETVGVGQDEVDIAETAHTTVVMVAPAMGDDIQAIKAGILEIAHIFVVNKADRDGATRTAAELRLMVEMGRDSRPVGAWEPPILLTEANRNVGVNELMEAIEQHRRYLLKDDAAAWQRHERDRIHRELEDILKGKVMEKIQWAFESDTVSRDMVEQIIQKKIDPYTAAEKILDQLG